MTGFKVFALTCALAVSAFTAHADPGPDEPVDSLLGGSTTVAECTVTGVGECTTTWEMSGNIAYYFHMDFHNIVAVGSYVVTWSDADGEVQSWSCPYMALGPGCVQSDYLDASTGIYSTSENGCSCYSAGTQTFRVQVLEATCAPEPCQFHAAFRLV